MQGMRGNKVGRPCVSTKPFGYRASVLASGPRHDSSAWENRIWRFTHGRASAAACLLLFLFTTFRTLLAADLPPALPRLPRTNLLVFHDRTGAVLPVNSKAGWQQRRAETLRGMETVMGPLPGREKRWPP